MSVAEIHLVSSLAGKDLSILSSLCVAQFRSGELRTAVLTFVLMQDGHSSLLFSCVLWTAIATVSSRPYCDSGGNIPFDPLHFALMPPILDSMARSHMQFADIHHFVGRSDSLGIIPCWRIKVGLVKSLRCRRPPDCNCHSPTR
jgi:hypothetical protein